MSGTGYTEFKCRKNGGKTFKFYFKLHKLTNWCSYPKISIHNDEYNFISNFIKPIARFMNSCQQWHKVWGDIFNKTVLGRGERPVIEHKQIIMFSSYCYRKIGRSTQYEAFKLFTVLTCQKGSQCGMQLILYDIIVKKTW